MRRKTRGFTLIELMIVVAIIGILAGIGYPSYRNYIKKGNRSAAHAQMMDIANRQQQYLLANRNYADKSTLISNGYAMPADVSKNYNWAVATAASGSPPAFTITFSPISTSVMNGDGDLTLNSSGGKTGTW